MLLIFTLSLGRKSDDFRLPARYQIASAIHPQTIMGRKDGQWGRFIRVGPGNAIAGGLIWRCCNWNTIGIAHERRKVKSYVFQIELEPDDDGWRAFCPPWENIGASTWGQTQEEALRNIEEVLAMIIEEFNEGGQPVPLSDKVTVLAGASVAVNL